MTIERKDVEHVARLARLRLSDDQVEPTRRELEKILAYVERLNELDTEGVPEFSLPGLDRLPLRPGEPEPSLGQVVALAEAPRAQDGAFAVPAFLEES